MSHQRYLSRTESVQRAIMLIFVLAIGSMGCSSTDSEPTSVGEKSVRLRKDDSGKVIEVSFVGAQASDADMKVLSEHRDLQSVTFMECSEITDAGFESLKELTGLTNLSMTKTLVGDAGLAALSKVDTNKLTSIALTSLPLTDKGITALAVASNCEHLEFFGLPITDESLQPISALTKLQHLAVQECSNITGSGFAHLQSLTALTELSLGGTLLTDEGMQELARLPHLESVLLDPENITDGGLSHVSQLATLKRFECVGRPISDAGLAHMAALPALEILTIGECPGITDDGLKSLGEIKTLTKLAVVACPGITDAGLVHLEPLSNLKVLRLMDTRVTEAGVRELKTKLPECTIHYGITPNGKSL